MGQVKFLLYSLLFFFLMACQRHAPIVDIPQPKADYNEEKIAVNQEIARREAADIELIAKRYNWNLIQTESGLLYQILQPKNEQKPQKGNLVQIEGSIVLPDGTTIYDSQTDGIKEFIVNGSDDAVGLHELVQLMSKGDQAQAIIPSFLAYGITGDGIMIPGLSSLICEITLINIK